MFFLINRKMASLFRGVFSSTDDVLDVGCGENPTYHRHIPSRITCTDVMRTRKAAVISDAQHLPFKEKSFEGVVCVNSLYYYEEPRIALLEFSRVLKKKGMLVLITPFIYPLHDAPYDKYRFTEFGLQEILKHNFAVERIVPLGGLFSLPLLLLHSLKKALLRPVPLKGRRIFSLLLAVLFFIPEIFLTLASFLDVLDRSRRWPIYYFTIARKK